MENTSFTGGFGIKQDTGGGGAGSEIEIGVTPIVGGANGEVLFNDAGVVGSDAGLTFDKGANLLTVTGEVLTPLVTADTVMVDNTGLHIQDTDASHELIIKPGSNLAADRTLTITTGDADRTISVAGNLTTAADFSTSGANALTLTTTGPTNVTLPTTGTLATLAGAEALTNKSVNGMTITSTTGTLTLANGSTLVTSGANSVTLTSSGATNVTLPTTGTLSTLAGTETLTNKRITPREVSMADATSFTPTGDTADVNTQANTQSAGALTANAPSGTPTAGQKLIIRIKSTNVQTFSWNAIYRGSNTVTLPVASTGSSKTDYFAFIYNSADSKWDCVAASYGYT